MSDAFDLGDDAPVRRALGDAGEEVDAENVARPVGAVGAEAAALGEHGEAGGGARAARRAVELVGFQHEEMHRLARRRHRRRTGRSGRARRRVPAGRQPLSLMACLSALPMRINSEARSGTRSRPRREASTSAYHMPP